MTYTDVLQSELNPFSPAIRDDPYPTYKALREASPISQGAPGMWFLTRFRDCETVLQDARFGFLEEGEEPTNPMFGRMGDGIEPLTEPDGTPVHAFITLNPPSHTRLRGLLSSAFTARRVQELEGRITEIVDGLLDTALASEKFDLLSTVCYPLSVTVISELLGVPPGDYEVFCGWTEQICAGLDPALMGQEDAQKRMRQARQEFSDYFMALARERREKPSDDLLSAMANAQEGDDRMTDVELVVTSTLLLIAGHETTANYLGNSVLALLRHPEEMARLAGRPEVTAAEADELLRYDPPGQLASRFAREDVELDGVQISKGDVLLPLLGAANRDPERFAEPDRLDLTRRNVRHLSFGYGIHLCLGAQLARKETRIALRRLLDRAPGLEVAGDLHWKPHATLRAMQEFPLVTNAS
jgi:cytochrome P450